MRNQILISSKECYNAYTAALEYIEQEWGPYGAFDDYNDGIYDWAGDVLSDFLDKFLSILNIYEVDEE